MMIQSRKMRPKEPEAVIEMGTQSMIRDQSRCVARTLAGDLETATVIDTSEDLLHSIDHQGLVNVRDLPSEREARR